MSQYGQNVLVDIAVTEAGVHQTFVACGNQCLHGFGRNVGIVVDDTDLGQFGHTRDVKGRIDRVLLSGDGAEMHFGIEDVAERVKLCALPSAIYEAYKRVLPKRKPKFLDEALQEMKAQAEAEANVQQTLDFGENDDNMNEEGGEA